jgi:hypothetical protein
MDERIPRMLLASNLFYSASVVGPISTQRGDDFATSHCGRPRLLKCRWTARRPVPQPAGGKLGGG